MELPACEGQARRAICRVIEESNMTSVSGIPTLWLIPLKYFILRVDSFYPQDIAQENMSGHVPCCCHLIYLRHNVDASCSTELITFQESRFISLGTITLSLGVIRLPQRISLTSRKCSHRKSLSILFHAPIIRICSFWRWWFQVPHKIAVFIITLLYLFLIFWPHSPPCCQPLSLSPLLLLSFLLFHTSDPSAFNHMHMYMCVFIHIYTCRYIYIFWILGKA